MRSAQTSEAAGPGHGELRPLPGRHGNEENWKAFEIYLKIFIDHNMTPDRVHECDASPEICLEVGEHRDFPPLRLISPP